MIGILLLLAIGVIIVIIVLFRFVSTIPNSNDVSTISIPKGTHEELRHLLFSN